MADAAFFSSSGLLGLVCCLLLVRPTLSVALASFWERHSYRSALLGDPGLLKMMVALVAFLYAVLITSRLSVRALPFAATAIHLTRSSFRAGGGIGLRLHWIWVTAGHAIAIRLPLAECSPSLRSQSFQAVGFGCGRVDRNRKLDLRGEPSRSALLATPSGC